MDQPFESDVMDDLLVEPSMPSADHYEAMDAEAFDAFGDEMDDLANENFAAFDDDFGDALEGDLWDDQGESGDEFQPHQQNRRESNRARHEQGASRRQRDRGGEKGDTRRQVPRRRPPGYKGTWPPPQTDRADDFFDDEMDDLAADWHDEMGDDFTPRADLAEAELADPMEEMDAAIADALATEDSDEFLRRITRSVRQVANVARQVGRGVGQVARVVGPVASMIPLPQAQAIGAIANMAGRLLADGADEFAALDELLDFAEAEDAVDAAAPIIAGLTIRTMMPSTARLNPATRRQLVQSVRQSTQTLARQQGAPAIRAIPRVVGAVQRTAQRRQLPSQQLPQAIRRATASVARNPRLVSRLAHATQQASRVTRQSAIAANRGIPQRLVIQGPVEIIIRSR